MNRSLRVVKVGGSLLNQPDFVQRLRDWLSDARGDNDLLLITGGGAAADWLREQWAAGKISNEQAHWDAIQEMDYNAEVLSAILAIPLIESPNDRRSGLDVALVSRFLREVEPTLPGATLPIGWEVTSDSIAARIAGLLGAGLALLKSCPPPDGADVQKLAEVGYVDAFFPQASLGLREILFRPL